MKKDAALSFLQDRRETLQQELAKVEAAIRAYTHATSARPASVASREDVERLTNPEAIRWVLRKAKAALTIREIQAALEKAGHPIRTTDPYRTIRKVLSDRLDEFENTNGSWTAKGEK